MKYIVSVEKVTRSTGSVTVECDTEEQAIELVQRQIDSGEIKTSDVEWDDPRYEDFSFTTTGDVD
jgi:hypothetical protein